MTDPIRIAIKRLPNGGGLPFPAYATAGAAGMDVVAAESLRLAPGARHAVATGFAIAIPDGYEVQVRPRSGLALKHGVTCLNTPGTIDHDYRGEVKVILANLGDEPFEDRARRPHRPTRSGPGSTRDAGRGRRTRRHRPRQRRVRLDGTMMLLSLALQAAAAARRRRPTDWSALPPPPLRHPRLCGADDQVRP